MAVDDHYHTSRVAVGFARGVQPAPFELIDGSSDGSSDDRSDGRSDGRNDGSSDGRSDGSNDGSSDGRSDGSVDASITWLMKTGKPLRA